MGRYSTDDETAKRYFATALAGFIDIAPKANKMSSYFQYRIGKMYLYGCGTEKAPDIASKWLEKSAVADNKYA
jgi:TPR repeat protein